MKQHDFEVAVLRLWTQTRIPLTRANLLVATEAPRTKVDGWLGELVKDGTLEVDSDKDGELLWRVRGAARPTRGPSTLEELHKLERLREEVEQKPGGIVRRPSTALGNAPAAEEKSVVASTALSFFFGPFGWLYAAPLKDSLVGIALFGLVTSIAPLFALRPILGVAFPFFALSGALYAWRYNKTGKRQSLLWGSERKRLPPGQ